MDHSMGSFDNLPSYFVLTSAYIGFLMKSSMVLNIFRLGYLLLLTQASMAQKSDIHSSIIHKIDSLNEISEKYEYEDHGKATQSAIQALNLSSRHNSFYGMGYSLSSLANVHLHMAKYDTAEALLIKCLSIDSVLGEPGNFVVDYANLANVMARSGNYEKSIDYSFLALEIATENNLELYTAAIYNNLASRYMDINNPEQALEVCEKAITIWTRYPSQEYNLGTIYLNLSTLYFDNPKLIPENQPEIVKDLLKKAERNFEICQDDYKLNDVKHQKAILKMDEGDFEAAYMLTKEAEHYFDSTANFLLLGDSKILLGTALSELGRFDESLIEIDAACHLADSLGIWDIRQRAMFTKAEILHKMGRYKESSKILHLSYSLRDSVMNNELKLKLKDLEASYDLSEVKAQKLELENEALEFNQREESLQNLILTISLSSLILLLIVFWILRTKQLQIKLQRSEHQKARAKEKQQIAELNLRVLASQMNPHFTKNALSTLQELIESNELDKSSTYLETFSRLQRTILNSAFNKSISLEEEVSLLKDYIMIEQLRWEKPFQFELFLGEDLDLEYDRIPAMMIQPLVENAIIHGLFHKKSTGSLSVSFTKVSAENESSIQCEIRDDGPGLEFSKNLKLSVSKSHGMKIIEDRLRLLSSSSNTTYSLIVEDELDPAGKVIGTLASISIPLL